EGADHLDGAGGAAEHRLGLLADREDGTVAGMHGHDGRLVDDDAAPRGVDERVRGPEVHGEVAGKQLGEGALEHGYPLSRWISLSVFIVAHRSSPRELAWFRIPDRIVALAAGDAPRTSARRATFSSRMPRDGYRGASRTAAGSGAGLRTITAFPPPGGGDPRLHPRAGRGRLGPDCESAHRRPSVPHPRPGLRGR